MTDGRRFFVAGKAGSGKTVLSKRLVEKESRVIIFDPKDDREWKEGAEVLDHFAQFQQFLYDMGDGAFRVYYSPEGLKEEKRLSTLSRMLLDWQCSHNAGEIDRPVTLVVDEMSDAFPLHVRGDNTGFAELCRKGRSFGISILGIAQRPAEVGATFRGNLNGAACFTFSFVNDVKAMATVMQDQELEKIIPSLAQYESIVWDGSKWQKQPPVAA